MGSSEQPTGAPKPGGNYRWLVLALIFFVPAVATWLPNLIG